MSGEATASDVPRLWSDRYKAYLGVRVPDNARGALQDVHWSQGMVGYFPTYAFGSAVGAQLRAAMVRQGMDFAGLLENGNLAPIREWLRTHIWQHGRAKDSTEIIRDACGEEFSARYFCDYLVEKYSRIYSL
jgi:carboxypeptidase Taq